MATKRSVFGVPRSSNDEPKGSRVASAPAIDRQSQVIDQIDNNSNSNSTNGESEKPPIVFSNYVPTSSKSPIACEQCDAKIASAADYMQRLSLACDQIKNPVQATADALKISRMTVHRALERYKRRLEGNFAIPRCGGHNKKRLTGAAYECIRFQAHNIWKTQGTSEGECPVAGVDALRERRAEDGPREIASDDAQDGLQSAQSRPQGDHVL